MNRLAEAALVNPTTGSVLLPFSRMEPSLRALRSQDEVLLAYVEAADAVDSLVKEQGPEKFQKFLSGTADQLPSGCFRPSHGRLRAGRRGRLGGGVLDGSPLDLGERSYGPPDFLQGPGARRGRGRLSSLLRAGDALRDKKQWPGALVQYRKALAVEPESGLLLSRAARAAQMSDDLKAAEGFLRESMAKNPFYVPPFAALGQILYDDGRYDEAQKVLQEGLEIQPFHPRLHETLGFISMDVGDAASARLSFQRSLDLDPDNPDLRDVMNKMPKGPPH